MAVEINVTEVNCSRRDRERKKRRVVFSPLVFCRRTSFSADWSNYKNTNQKQTQSRTSPTKWAKWVLAQQEAAVTAAQEVVWREPSKWFRVSQLPGESSSALPVWVSQWVGIWVCVCLSLFGEQMWKPWREGGGEQNLRAEELSLCALLLLQLPRLCYVAIGIAEPSRSYLC